MGRSPSPARSSHSDNASAFSSSGSSDTEERVSAMPPSPSGRSGVGGGRSGSDCSASGRASSPQPALSGLGSGEQFASCTDWSLSGFRSFGCGGRRPG